MTLDELRHTLQTARDQDNVPDLSGLDLRGVGPLADLDLRGANLSRANLSGATLARCILARATLRGATLGAAELVGCDLREADLADIAAAGARIIDCVLVGANLSHAQLDAADLSGSDLSEADWSEASLCGVNLTGGKLAQANLRRANLTGAQLQDVDLSGVTWEGAALDQARLDGVSLRGAGLAGVSLKGASLRGSDLSQADLRGADLERAALDGARLVAANLSQARLTRCSLPGADLRGANLQGAVLTAATLKQADLTAADLSGASLQGAEIDKANFAGSLLTGTDLGHTAYYYDDPPLFKGARYDGTTRPGKSGMYLRQDGVRLADPPPPAAPDGIFQAEEVRSEPNAEGPAPAATPNEQPAQARPPAPFAPALSLPAPDEPSGCVGFFAPWLRMLGIEPTPSPAAMPTEGLTEQEQATATRVVRLQAELGDALSHNPRLDTGQRATLAQQTRQVVDNIAALLGRLGRLRRAQGLVKPETGAELAALETRLTDEIGRSADLLESVLLAVIQLEVKSEQDALDPLLAEVDASNGRLRYLADAYDELRESGL